MPYDTFRYRRRSIRLRGYDYSQAGVYFVTICQANRECIFGDVVNGKMHPNQFGEIVLKWWNELPNFYSPVKLDEFIVMPNHLHGIIIITDVGMGISRAIPGHQGLAPTEKRTMGQLVAYLKFQITKETNRVRDSGYAKVLQRNYYEHIIRNEREWGAIAEYIHSNPANWRVDLDNPVNFPKRPPPKTSNEYWNDAVGARSSHQA